VRFPAGEIDHSLLQNIRTVFETHTLLFIGLHSHLLGVNRPVPEAGLFSPYKAEFKNAWGCNSTLSV